MFLTNDYFLYLCRQQSKDIKLKLVGMEERQQLPYKEGGCWEKTSPINSAEESSLVVALLQRLMGKVTSRGDLEYAQKVAEDTILALLDVGMIQPAQDMGQMVVNLRQQHVLEKKQQMAPWLQKLADQFNVLMGKDASVNIKKDE